MKRPVAALLVGVLVACTSSSSQSTPLSCTGGGASSYGCSCTQADGKSVIATDTPCNSGSIEAGDVLCTFEANPREHNATCACYRYSCDALSCGYGVAGTLPDCPAGTSRCVATNECRCRSGPCNQFETAVTSCTSDTTRRTIRDFLLQLPAQEVQDCRAAFQ